MNRVRLAALVVMTVAWAIAGPPPAEAQVYDLARVVVVGATRLPAATVVGITGLKPPVQVTPIDIERARQRLLDSGLFASVAYRFAMARYSLTVTFTVLEPPWDAPILFDNFVWFSDEALVRAVARELPTFTGLAPSLPRSLRRIAQALDRLIQEAGIQGSVSYMPATGNPGGATAYLYRVDLPAAMPVCAIEMDGISPAMAADARASVHLAIGQNYSRDFVGKILTNNLLPLYGQWGYLKAAFSAIRARPAAAERCVGGVAVAVLVREGRSYTWGGATWDGADLPPAELDARLGMVLGEVVDTSRLERGLQAIREHYARQGYIAARALHVFEFVEDAGTASATVTLARGPRVKMGLLEIRGLPAEMGETLELLKGEWTHAAGEYYDALYINAYLKSARAKLPSVFRVFPNVSITTMPDAGSTVNVTITFSR